MNTKAFLLGRIRRALVYDKLSTYITAALEERSVPIPKFWERNYCEHTVQIALKDYCRPGNVVFDLGTNIGGLAIVMSRLVGPKGIVCGFEASPRIIDKANYNLVAGGCSNVTLYHRAVFHTSHEVVTLFPGTHLNDSIYNDHKAEGGATYRVETVALDDFVEASGLHPSFIKMDIEGAEFDALNGASKLLAQDKPTLILEQSPSDMRCHQLLTSAGYVAVDLANYKAIRSAEDFGKSVSVANVLFVHSSKAKTDPYVNAGEPVEVCSLPAEAFDRSRNGSYRLKELVELPAGRYLCVADFTAEGRQNEVFAGIDTDRERIFRYHTYTAFMAESYRHWMFSIGSATRVTPYLQFVSGADPSLLWRGATIYRYPSFDTLRPPVVY